MVEVTATDDGAGSLTDVQTITVTVTDVNDPPVIVSRTPVDTLVLIDPGQSVQFDVESQDEEGDLLTLQWLVDGVQLSTASSFLHVADTTSADTVVATDIRQAPASRAATRGRCASTTDCWRPDGLT